MRAGRLVRRALLVVAALVVVSAATVVLLARAPAFHEWLRRRVVAELNASLTAAAAIGALDGNLLDHLVLRDVRLVADGRRVLAVRRLSVRYDLLRLLVGRGLVLRDVEIDGLALTLVEDAHGWNVARLMRTQGEPGRSGTLAVVLADARVADASVKVVRPADVWRLRDARLAGSARFGPRGQSITVATLSGDLPGRQVRIAELSGTVALDDDAARVGGLHLRTDDSELRVDARVPRGADGAYDVTVDARLAAGEVRRLARSAAPAADLALTAHLRGPARWAALDAVVKSAAGSIALDGNVGQGEPPSYALRARLEAVDLAALLGPSRPTTALTGTAELKGRGLTLADGAASASVELRDSTLVDRALSRLSAHGELAAQRLTFAATVALDAGTLDANGSVGLTDERYELRGSATRLDVATLLGRPEAHTRLTGTASAAGRGFDPGTTEGELHLALAPSMIAGLDVASGQADVRATAGLLTVDRLRLDARTATLDASGTLGRQADALPSSGSLRYALRATDVAPLARLARLGPLTGSVGVEGTAGGSLDALALRATITAQHLARGGVEVGRLAGAVTADDLGSPRGRATLEAHGDAIHAAGRRFAAVDVRGSWRASGDASAAAHVEVRAQEDERHRHEVVADAILTPGERRLTIGAMRLDLGDETWRAEGTPVLVQRGQTLVVRGLALRSRAGVMRAEGQVGTIGGQDLTVEVGGLDVAALAPPARNAMSGRLAGTAHLGGTAQAPTVEVHAAIADPTIARVRYERAALDARIGGGRAQVTARVVQSAARELTLDATSPLRVTLAPFAYASAGTLSGSLRARDVDLALLGPLVPQVSDVRGRLDADLTLGGTLTAPDVHGPLTLAGGRAHVIPLGLTYDPIEVRMALDGAAATIETLRIASGRGVLTARGSARVAGTGSTLDVHVQLERFPLFANQFGEGATSGTITVTGTSAAPIVEGALTTDRFVLRVPETLPGSVRPPDPTITVVGPGAPPAAAPSGTVAEAPGAAAPRIGIYERAAITVQVDVPNNAWIRRSDAEIELRGWMTAWKKPMQPLALAGEIDTVRGWYTFQGRTFTVESGRVTFTGQDFDPLLDLTAVHTAGDYTVRVKLGGVLSKPTLALESEPSLDQADILSVLLFGKPASQLSSGESAGLREQAIGVAGSYVASGLRESVAETLGLDTLQFESGSSGVQSSSLTLGKYVAPDVFVSLAHRFAKQGAQELRVEYRITPHWSVETSADTLGDSGIDVFWKNRY